MSSYHFELALRQYFAAFDGTNNISPAEFRSRFENLNHKDFTFRLKDGTILTREEVYEHDTKLLASGIKVKLIYIRRIGLDNIDIKIEVANGDEHKTVRVVATISEGKTVICREIDESPEANFFYLTPATQVMEAKVTNAVYKWKEIGTHGTNM